MRKTLVIIMSALTILLCFTGCKGSAGADVRETTTAPVVASTKIETGEVKGGIYRNKSLGFKIYCPKNFDSQTAGDLVLTPETVNDLPDYDYFIIDQKEEAKKAQSVAVTIEKHKKSQAVKDAQKMEAFTIGNREYTAYEKASKNKKVYTTYFKTSNGETDVTIEFYRYNYDEATQFILEYFKTM